MKILVVEDEHRIATAIKKGLEQENFSVDLSYDGESGYDLAMSGEYDLVILDLMLPQMDGITICRSLREAGIHTPVLMLTAKGQIGEKVEGLEAGADDYMLKPFAFSELVARVKALLRRPATIIDTKLSASDIVLDIDRFRVTRAGREVALTRKEFNLLHYLVRNAGHVVSKDNIISHVWEYDADILTNTIEVYIRTLRRKLGSPDIIKTIRGFGYTIDLTV